MDKAEQEEAREVDAVALDHELRIDAVHLRLAHLLELFAQLDVRVALEPRVVVVGVVALLDAIGAHVATVALRLERLALDHADGDEALERLLARQLALLMHEVADEARHEQVRHRVLNAALLLCKIIYI